MGIKDRRTIHKAANGLMEKGFLLFEYHNGKREGDYSLNLDCEEQYWVEDRTKIVPNAEQKMHDDDAKNASDRTKNVRQSYKKCTDGVQKMYDEEASDRTENVRSERGPYHVGEKLRTHEIH
jgi:hypothetical protein